MTRAANLLLLPTALALVACDNGAQPSEDIGETAAPENQATAPNLTTGTLGTVRYHYDPAALTRAEIDLALPPDFDQSVFAVKFIPASLAENLGEDACSFGSIGEGHSCSAIIEVGFALALLERPMADYAEALERAAPADGALEPLTLAGHEGMAFTHQSFHTTTRYTFVPSGSRTLLLVDRYTEGVDEASEALMQVQDSIEF